MITDGCKDLGAILADLARLQIDHTESSELYRQAHEKFNSSVALRPKNDPRVLIKWSDVCLEHFLRFFDGKDTDGHWILLQKVIGPFFSVQEQSRDV